MTTVTDAQTHPVAGVLQNAFREVIETMFGLPLEGPEPAADGAARDARLSAMIGLAGSDFRGLLRISCTHDGARMLAATLLGGEEMVGDDASMVADSLGELANMLGGTFKRAIDSSGVLIELSLPSVIEGEVEVIDVSGSDAVRLRWNVDGRPVETSLLFSGSSRRAQ
jgi:CheY-specific phosphatase CheX